MTRMQDIEASIGEHNAPAVAFFASKLQNQFVQCQNGRMQSFSTMADNNGRLGRFSDDSFYHGSSLSRFQVRRFS